jgi:hypothetical protein
MRFLYSFMCMLVFLGSASAQTSTLPWENDCMNDQFSSTTTNSWNPNIGDLVNSTENWSCDSNCHWYQPDCLAYRGYCNTFRKLGGQLQDKIAFAIAREPQVADTAKRDGWTKTSCYAVATPLVGLLLMLKATPICAAFGAGVGTPACLAVVGTMTGAIVGGTCIQLCHDHNLLDAECQ